MKDENREEELKKEKKGERERILKLLDKFLGGWEDIYGDEFSKNGMIRKEEWEELKQKIKEKK